MGKNFTPEKYGMMACPDCDGQGRICSPDMSRFAETVEDLGLLGRKERLTSY